MADGPRISPLPRISLAGQAIVRRIIQIMLGGMLILACTLMLWGSMCAHEQNLRQPNVSCVVQMNWDNAQQTPDGWKVPVIMVVANEDRSSSVGIGQGSWLWWYYWTDEDYSAIPRVPYRNHGAVDWSAANGNAIVELMPASSYWIRCRAKIRKAISEGILVTDVEDIGDLPNAIVVRLLIALPGNLELEEYKEGVFNYKISLAHCSIVWTRHRLCLDASQSGGGLAWPASGIGRIEEYGGE